MIKLNPSATLTLILVCLSVNACREAPRYTLHEGTDPGTGIRCTLQLDDHTGQSTILRVVAPSSSHSLYYWEPIHDQRTALAVLKAYGDATNSGPMTIK